MDYKKIMIAVNLNRADQKPFDKLKNSTIFEGTEVHLVHVLEVQPYSTELSLFFYPNQSEYPRIKKKAEKELEHLQRKIFPHTGNPKVVVKCLIGDNAKENFAQYSKKVKADLLIVATRGKKGIKGFFDSSFARYLSKYSPADLLILRS